MGTMCGRMVEALLTVARMGLEPSPLPESGQSAGWYFEEYLNAGWYFEEYLNMEVVTSPRGISLVSRPLWTSASLSSPLKRPALCSC
jgi:hypothetical protein